MMASMATSAAPTTSLAASKTPRQAGVSPASRNPSPVAERSATSCTKAGRWKSFQFLAGRRAGREAP